MTTTTDRRSNRFSLGALAAATASTGLLGLGTLLYANRVELNAFTVRHMKVPVLPDSARAGSQRPVNVPTHPAGLRILHISDIHYVPGQRKKFSWLQSLNDYQPDLVINTGDNLSHREAVPEVLEALAPLREFPGVFVPGSNDYFAPQLRNPLRYFAGPSRLAPHADPLPTGTLFSGFESSGWVNLTNTSTSMQLNGLTVHLSGVDDPHIGRDEFSGWPTDAADLRLGVAHAPVQRVLQTFANTGADLMLTGHTHGGQLCLPGGHALVTNCDLPRRQAKGLSTIRSSSGADVPLHVSAGIGTSAKAPVRLNCPPEATIIDLTSP